MSSKNNRSRLWGARKAYERHARRSDQPFKLHPNPLNWTLLRDGLNVYWDGIMEEMREYLYKDWDRVMILLDAQVDWSKFTNLQFHTSIPLDVAIKLKDVGIKYDIVLNQGEVIYGDDDYSLEIQYFDEQFIDDIIDLSRHGIDVIVHLRRVILEDGSLVHIARAHHLEDEYTLVDEEVMYKSALTLPYIRELINQGVRVVCNELLPATDPILIEELRELGMELKFRMDMVYANTLQEADNISVNLDGTPLRIRDYSVIPYFEFIGAPYIPPTAKFLSYDHYYMDTYPYMNDEEKDELFKQILEQGSITALRYVLQQGYIPDLTNNYGNNIMYQITVLEEIQLDSDEKYELWKQFVRSNVKNWRSPSSREEANAKQDKSLRSWALFFHPSIEQYWIRLDEEELATDMLPRPTYNEIKKWKQVTSIGDSDPISVLLSYVVKPIQDYAKRLEYGVLDLELWKREIILRCEYERYPRNYELIDKLFESTIYWRSEEYSNPLYSSLWSIIPSDYEPYLWFLYRQGIELPPPINPNHISIPRLLTMDPIEAINHILSNANEEKWNILIKFLNITGINLRSIDIDHPTINFLRERQPIKHIKSARSRIH